MAVPGLRERMKALTRDAIVDAADHLFLEHGYADVSLDDVAAAAGVSLRTLYRYFETDPKESIALARESDTVERFEAGLSARTGDVLDYWRSVVTAGVSELGDRGENWFRRHVAMIQTNPALDARNRMINARYSKLLAAALAEERGRGAGRDDLGPALFAAALVAGQFVVFERWLETSDRFDPELLHTVIDYVTDAFEPKLAEASRGRGRRRAG